ncbi:MAG TPA: type I 3-dehydroquinate dehydratase [Patescibacteria group bacterium]|nr:type I 3-dehydroquinate dehydratase [Patescibacteria group bacterium]
MKDKYCLPIIKESPEDIFLTIKRLEHDYGYFEIWLDYLNNIDESKILTLANGYPGRLVFVFRRKNLEPIQMPLATRLNLIDKLSKIDCLVDIDISCQQDELEYIKDNAVQFGKIISFHDYEKTPEDKELKDKINQMQSYEADILKISTFCNSKNDAIRLMKLQTELIENNQKHIVLGMGENGLVTRIFGTLWGNELAFIPEDSENETAPGQITKAKFETIMKELTD